MLLNTFHIDICSIVSIYGLFYAWTVNSYWRGWGGGGLAIYFWIHSLDDLGFQIS